MTLTIQFETPDQPEVRAMLDQLDAYCGELYPAESNHLMDIASLLQPGVHFLVAREQGVAVGCGAFVERDGYAEIKRMFVAPSQRGKGSGRKLLDAISVEARAQGITILRLETGIHQPEAIGLYETAGFALIPPFGDYQPDPLSIFMEKAL